MIILIIKAVLVLCLLALILASFLYLASKKFEEKVDPRVEEIIKVLPGVNCGACGFAGCKEFAHAVVKGEAKFDGCKVGKEKVSAEIKRILDKPS